MKTRKPSAVASKRAQRRPERWKLSLYVADQDRKSLEAFRNLKAFCEKYLSGRYEIEITDLLADPRQARHDQIVAVPTVIRRLPLPIVRLVGDLSETEKVLASLGLPGDQAA